MVWGSRGPTSLSIKLSCIPGCPAALRRADLSLISASKAALCCCSLFSSALTVSMMIHLSTERLDCTGSLGVCLLGASSAISVDLAVYVMLFRNSSILQWPAATVHVVCHTAIICGVSKLPWRSSIASTATETVAQRVHKHKLSLPGLKRTV